MASDYTPTNVTTGFGAEAQINQNFSDIKTAMDKLMNRLITTDNAMAIALDMGNNRILNLPEANNPTDPVLLSQLNALTIEEVVSTITYATTINVDVDTTTFGKLTLTGNVTAFNFTGTPKDGQPFILAVKQDGVGGHSITWESRVRFSNDLPSFSLSSAPNTLDYILFRYYEDDDKFDVLAVNRGF